MKAFPKGKTSSVKINKKQHVLLFFLLIASLFWLLTRLSYTYTDGVVYKVNYKNLPPTKFFQNDPESTLELKLKASGFKLLLERIYQKEIAIDLEDVVRKGKYVYYLLSTDLFSSIQSQLNTRVELVEVKKDSLFFELGLNKQKKVPVISDLNIRFKSGYNLSDKILVRPDSIDIRGPEIQIDKIKDLKLETLDLSDVSEDIYQDANVKLPENLDKVSYSSKMVTVVAQVEKFTEGSFEVPFTVRGLPEGIKIITYPKTVKVVFQVGISNYSKITANDFKVSCNYSVSRTSNFNYLSPEIIEKPSLVNAVRLIPNHIEYLIQK